MVDLHNKFVLTQGAPRAIDKVIYDPWEIRIRHKIHDSLGHGANPVGRDDVPRKRSSYEPSLTVRTGGIRVENGN